ncbi:PIN/TRAM domain-containing protein [Clostridium sp. MSJ-4]|uniref:PIN/TRAM domain-containing protein n=1 Tax=Clostridium simiarum TaxID=2841506 RepID=A0ABS6F089_9CLOT|nr:MULTISPECIES: PIN/TRAM domain-containing protein [Clostridium]MBU5591716.1 PIN/TRAM domain-containing protein [Clostridium simiarum]
MLKKVLRSLFTVIGLVVGYFIGVLLLKTEYLQKTGYFNTINFKTILFLIFTTLLFGLILFLISPWINKLVTKVVDYIEKSMQKLTAIEILFGAMGAIIALIISSLLASVLNTSLIGKIIYAAINIVAAVIGADIAIKRREDMMSFIGSIKKVGSSKDKKSKSSSRATPKVLDTSVIIDGRIFDICQTGFIEGVLIIPNFVLAELRHIADSSDSLKRTRGRRGLDILNKIQKELSIEVQISEKDFPDIAEVDNKLLKLAQVLDGKVITNDYNLNKVAEFQGVPVLNINELANAIKPVVLPGEEMTIQVIKDGKESGQGVAYLDDGTMIVVEGGRKYIGEIIDVIVTSVLQTAAGRMIFAKQKDAFER